MRLQETKEKIPYFENWYFKHQSEAGSLALIPGFHVEEDGSREAFVQIVTDEGSGYVHFTPSMFHSSPDSVVVQLGNNIFTSKGLSVNLKAGEISVCGTLRYEDFTPLKSGKMDLFSSRLLGYHQGIVSLHHRIHGILEVNGKILNFRGGTGYIEKDWGVSLPQTYLWTQCDGFLPEACCVTASFVDIPTAKDRRKECASYVYYRGKEYRFSTQRGAKVTSCAENGLELQQGNRRLTVTPLDLRSTTVKTQGGRIPVLHEPSFGRVRYRFSEGEKAVFDVVSSHSGFEFIHNRSAFRS